MGFKENLDKEKHALLSTKRPYETAAFIIFSLLFIQQLLYLGRSLYKFVKDGGNFSTTNITAVGNLQAFFNRTVFVDSSKWLYVLLAIGILVLYYFLIYIFVWNYCKKRNLAKWTWTLLVVFGPGMFFMPAYMFYVLYVFRDYIFKFIKTIVEEYKAFDPTIMAEQEAKLLLVEEKEAEERSIVKNQKDSERAEKNRVRKEERAEASKAKKEQKVSKEKEEVKEKEVEKK